MKFNFRRVQKTDYPTLLEWHLKPHVREWWTERSTIENITQNYDEKLASDHVYPYIVELNGKPIGYIQRYNASKVKDGWWENQPDGTWGVDQFIGEETLLDQGIGTAMIKEFTSKMFKGGEAKRIITDPKPDNARAIRAYEKAGFRRVGPVQTPDGEAMLMEMLRKSEGRDS